MALSGKTPLHHRGSGHERQSARLEGGREARKVSKAERRSCGAVPGVQTTRRTGDTRGSRLWRFVGGAGCPPVPYSVRQRHRLVANIQRTAVMAASRIPRNHMVIPARRRYHMYWSLACRSNGAPMLKA